MNIYQNKKNAGRWSALIDKLKNSYPKLDWRAHEWEIFFEVEALLHLHTLLVGRDENVAIPNPQEAWVLVSGYTIEGINADEPARQMCLALRSVLRYVKTASAWKLWLHWYLHESRKPLRLFHFHHADDENAPFTFQENPTGALFRQERIDAYAQLYQLQHTPTSDSDKQPIAVAGNHIFFVDQTRCQIDISEAFAAFASTQAPHLDLPDRTAPRDPITIDIDADLIPIAAELDRLEEERGIEPRGNWHSRLTTLRVLIPETQQAQRHLTIDGIFHLAGMLGAGKSTLIWVMVYYLATHCQLHLTVVMNTVVEMIRFAVWLRRLDVIATPALGRHRRAEHAQKYGWANAAALDPALVFQTNYDEGNNHALNWLVTPCALSGMQTTPIPVGKEPCYQLLDATGKKHRCPLINRCPVHQVSRDLIESQVWVVNPYSFLYSRAPEGLADGERRLLEAIYRQSDLVIIDEADRVQVQWDDAFAPTRQLVGGDQSFLDALHRTLGQRSLSVGRFGRRRSARAQFHRLTNIDDRAHTLSNHLFRVIAKAPKVAKWLKNKQLTNAMFYYRLTERLVKLLPNDRTDADREKLRVFLRDTFRGYWATPFRDKTNFLTEWVRRIGDPDRTEQAHKRQLAQWLADIMGWELPLRDKRLNALNLLDFAVTFTALLKYTSDLTYLVALLDDELGDMGDESYTVPEVITSLVPDPPLGALLGVRHTNYAGASNLGMFNLLRYSGIGRWLLLNFPRLIQDQTGPHLLLTSATSWLPQSAQFHLDVPPNAVVLPPEDRPESTIELMNRPFGTGAKKRKISGTGKRREHNLRLTVRDLIKTKRNQPSILQQELDYWKGRGENRKLLLVVMSYEQVGWVRDELSHDPAWAGRVRGVIADDHADNGDDLIRARQVEDFHNTNTDILIAPLLSIQRGFNILDETEGALLGSVYFLVRPYPPPDDLKPQLLGLNAWTMRQLDVDGRRLSSDYAEYGIAAVKQLRKRAYGEWHRRVRANGGVDAMDADIYAEFLRDQFVAIWQTIGRLLRGGRDARVYFVDGAFAPNEADDGPHRNMLRDWYTMLEDMATAENPADRALARWLYGQARKAFQNAVNNREIR